MAYISEKELIETAAKIRLLILDVDGVLTDGSIILDNNDNEYKAFYVRDGHGIRMLQKAGVKVALITGRYSTVVERRAAELGVQDVFQRSFDKRVAYRMIAEKYSVRDSEIAYIGDDIVDIPVLKLSGLPVAVADADVEVKPFVKMVTRNRGGRGAVREVCDLLIKAQGLWKDIFDEYSQT